LCCVCCKDGSMEREGRKDLKQYKNGSKGKKPRQKKKKSRRGHGFLSLVSVVCCQVEVSASGWLFIQRSPTECGVSECDREAPRKGKTMTRQRAEKCQMKKKSYTLTYKNMTTARKSMIRFYEFNALKTCISRYCAQDMITKLRN
jgi:hypothetical protein